MKEFSDEHLITLIAQRDEEALRELYRRYAPYLKAVARRMTTDSDEMEQGVQDAFVKIWESADRFDPSRARAKTWMVTIAHRLMINRLRRHRHQTVELEPTHASSAGPDHVTRIYVSEALDTLDSESRELVELAFFQGHSHGEVADITGRPLGTVKTKIRRALISLREHFGEGGA